MSRHKRATAIIALRDALAAARAAWADLALPEIDDSGVADRLGQLDDLAQVLAAYLHPEVEDADGDRFVTAMRRVHGALPRGEAGG